MCELSGRSLFLYVVVWIKLLHNFLKARKRKYIHVEKVLIVTSRVVSIRAPAGKKCPEPSVFAVNLFDGICWLGLDSTCLMDANEIRSLIIKVVALAVATFYYILIHGQQTNLLVQQMDDVQEIEQRRLAQPILMSKLEQYCLMRRTTWNGCFTCLQNAIAISDFTIFVNNIA
ncbi:hypothetical protein ACJX0J_006015 [Zea mays]